MVTPICAHVRSLLWSGRRCLLRRFRNYSSLAHQLRRAASRPLPEAIRMAPFIASFEICLSHMHNGDSPFKEGFMDVRELRQGSSAAAQAAVSE